LTNNVDSNATFGSIIWVWKSLS